MADVTVKRLDEFEAIFGGGFRRVRAGLGVNSFGHAYGRRPAPGALVGRQAQGLGGRAHPKSEGLLPSVRPI